MIDENGNEVEVQEVSLEPTIMEDEPQVEEALVIEPVVEQVVSRDPSCTHDNTEVRNYNKKTLLGELWCHICGIFVKEYDHAE